MSSAEYPKFTGAKRYVKQGLRKDGASYEMKTDDYNGKIKGPVWDDTVIDIDKKGKPVLYSAYAEEFKSQEIIDAARFRDALVSVDEWEEGFDLESFYYAFHRTGFWAKEYKKHSKKIFDLVIKEEEIFGKCEGKHNFDEDKQAKADKDSESDESSDDDSDSESDESSDDDSDSESDESSDDDSDSDSDESAGFALCETGHYELALMRHHIRNCPGEQSDKLWRDKVFMILNDGLTPKSQKLNPNPNNSLRCPKNAKGNWGESSVAEISGD
jgi:hypothetical protein